MNQKQFYKSRSWRIARQAFIDKRMLIDGGLCQVCHEEPGLIVHHTVWLDDVNCNDPEIALNQELFRYECQTCHNKEQDPRRARAHGRVLFDADGEVIPIGEY